MSEEKKFSLEYRSENSKTELQFYLNFCNEFAERVRDQRVSQALTVAFWLLNGDKDRAMQLVKSFDETK